MDARSSTALRLVRGDLNAGLSPSETPADASDLGPTAGRLSVVGYRENERPKPLAKGRSAKRGCIEEYSQLAADRLSKIIKQRVRDRTSERVRDLEVICEPRRVILRGRCATFYTKQLAQHAAMGVIEDETVVNEITVGISR